MSPLLTQSGHCGNSAHSECSSNRLRCSDETPRGRWGLDASFSLSGGTCLLTQVQGHRSQLTVAALWVSRWPSTSVNFAKYWSSLLPRYWLSMKMAACYFTTRDCAKLLDTAKRSSISATAVCFGMTLISARGSLLN